MQADGFLSRRERHPVALTAAVAINVAAVGALLLAKGEVVERLPEAIRLIEIITPPPPPEIKPEPVRQKVTLPVPVPRPVVDRPLPTERQIETTSRETGPTVLPTTGDSGPATETIVAPRAEPKAPVLTDAAMDPRYASLFQPPYPARMQRLEIEGKVVVKVLIGADGRVKDVQIVYSDDDDFAAVTERQARTRWRFRPATRDGVGVETWKQLTVRFEIGRG